MTQSILDYLIEYETLLGFRALTIYAEVYQESWYKKHSSYKNKV